MADMSLCKTAMPERDPKIRNTDFGEVTLGYTPEMAVAEANRCLECKNPLCVSGCPVNVKIPDFIKLIKQNDFKAAYEKIAETNALPAICGRVCPQEKQCESKCVRAIKGESVAIGRLERFAADNFDKNYVKNIKTVKSNGRKVAVIGSGPSGLTCAGDLAKLGYKVTVFEAFHTAGGVLSYGIPEFRLPKEIVQREIENLKNIGVEILTDMVIGKILDVEDLYGMGYEAVFIATGAGLPLFLSIEGEGSVGVYSANEFLTRVNLMKAYRDDYDTPIKKADKIAVVGAGNVAMDAARCAKRLGASHVYIVYRRSEAEMPARKEEIEHAKQEGIEFLLLSNPKKIISDENGYVKALRCVKMELAEPDASGRRKPVEIENSDFDLDVSAVIMALGTTPNPLIAATCKGLEVNAKGCITVDGDMHTSLDGIYAGGDAVTGSATVILAMGAGKTAAKSIDEFLKNQEKNS